MIFTFSRLPVSKFLIWNPHIWMSLKMHYRSKWFYLFLPILQMKWNRIRNGIILHRAEVRKPIAANNYEFFVFDLKTRCGLGCYVDNRCITNFSTFLLTKINIFFFLWFIFWCLMESIWWEMFNKNNIRAHNNLNLNFFFLSFIAITCFYS